MKYLFLCSALLWAYANTFAQSQITGIVSDKQTGEAIPYVTVYNLNTQYGTTTDFLGQFTIEAKEKDSLQISYVGYEKITILALNSNRIELVTSSFSLNEVVVSANREQEKRTEVPVAISTVSSKTIEENKPTTIDQVLNQTPGMNMVDLGNEQHTMSIRRPIDYGASYLYLEDGVPIRTSGVFNHNALLEINMANTNRIEIIRGPASSIYGSEAIGGAINFISKKASTAPSAGLSLQGNDIGYKRADFYASNTFSKKLGIRVAGYYADQQNGIVKYSDFNKLALSLSANYAISEKTELVWNNSLIDYYSDMTGSLDSADFFSKNYESNQTFTNRQVNAYRTKLAINHYWNQYSKTTVTGYYRNNSVKQTPSYRVKDDYKPWIPKGDPNQAHGETNDNSFESYGVIAQHKQDFKWLNSSLIAGGSMDYSPNDYKANYIDIYKNDEGIYESYKETDSLLADYTAKLLNIAAYTQIKVQPIDGFNIIGALRFDQFNYDFDNDLDANAYTAVLDGKNTFSQFTPKVGAIYEFRKNRGVYANYSQGFVPPQVTELYRGNEIPTLKPVYYDNYEVGGWFAFAKNKAKLDVSVYKMMGENEIISVLQDDGSRIRQNAGKTLHQGIEYGLNLLLHKEVSFRISGTNAIHEFVEFDEAGSDLSGNKMPQAPEWIANTQITYRPAYLEGFRVSLEWQHINKYFMDQQNTKEYKGYDILNLRLGYTWKAFEVWMNVINASDQLYATVARSSKWGDSYSLGKPRNFNFGVAYKFKKNKIN
jgi:outer membrane receptor protein involved in Fe transport